MWCCLNFFFCYSLMMLMQCCWSHTGSVSLFRCFCLPNTFNQLCKEHFTFCQRSCGHRHAKFWFEKMVSFQFESCHTLQRQNHISSHGAYQVKMLKLTMENFWSKVLHTLAIPTHFVSLFNNVITLGPGANPTKCFFVFLLSLLSFECL